MSALTPFNSSTIPGFIVYIHPETNAVYTTQASLSQLCNVPHQCVSRYVKSLFERGALLDVLELEVVTQQGKHHRTLLGVDAIYDVMGEFAPSMLKIAAKGGIEAFCRAVAEVNKEPVEDGAQKLLTGWRIERNLSIVSHGNFMMCCKLYKFPASHVHNLMTTLCYNLNAAQSRLLPIVSEDLDATVGLNHQASAEQIKRVSDMKLKFASYRTGTWRERVARAYKATNID